MTNEEKLTILKHDLQILTDIHDDYLRGLLDTALALIAREGVTLSDTVEDNGLANYVCGLIYTGIEPRATTKCPECCALL